MTNDSTQTRFKHTNTESVRPLYLVRLSTNTWNCSSKQFQETQARRQSARRLNINGPRSEPVRLRSRHPFRFMRRGIYLIFRTHQHFDRKKTTKNARHDMIVYLPPSRNTTAVNPRLWSISLCRGRGRERATLRPYATPAKSGFLRLPSSQHEHQSS